MACCEGCNRTCHARLRRNTGLYEMGSAHVAGGGLLQSPSCASCGVASSSRRRRAAAPYCRRASSRVPSCPCPRRSRSSWSWAHPAWSPHSSRSSSFRSFSLAGYSPGEWRANPVRPRKSPARKTRRVTRHVTGG
eukprot:2524214-Prymnesium_polylepis.1